MLSPTAICNRASEQCWVKAPSKGCKTQHRPQAKANTSPPRRTQQKAGSRHCSTFLRMGCWRNKGVEQVVASNHQKQCSNHPTKYSACCPHCFQPLLPMLCFTNVLYRLKMTNYQQLLTPQLSIPFVSAYAYRALGKPDCKICYITCLPSLLLTVDDCAGQAIAYLNQDKHYFHVFHHHRKAFTDAVLEFCSTDSLCHFLDLNTNRTWAQGGNSCHRQIGFYLAKNTALHAS